MVPDPFTLEKMVLVHRQQLQREAEHERLLGELPTHSSNWMRYVAARLGTFLIALGTRLRQLEQYSASIAVDEVRRKESLC
jgi:hypothetical protein